MDCEKTIISALIFIGLLIGQAVWVSRKEP